MFFVTDISKKAASSRAWHSKAIARALRPPGGYRPFMVTNF